MNDISKFPKNIKEKLLIFNLLKQKDRLPLKKAVATIIKNLLFFKLPAPNYFFSSPKNSLASTITKGSNAICLALLIALANLL